MLILTSPAKTLDYTSEYQAPFSTQPHFVKEAEELMRQLRKLTTRELAKLMEVSTDIAEVNRQRFKIWTEKHTLENSRPAIVAYAGDIYRQIHEYEYTEQQAQYLQDSLRIMSGLYGLLKPYDLIQPYRLEMKVPLKNSVGSNLVTFWKERLTNFLNFEIVANKQSVIIDLASDEYTSPIDWKKVHAKVVHIVFHQIKNNVVVNIGLVGKKSRGIMIDFMVKNRIYDIEQLLAFKEDGYSYTDRTADSLVFTKTFVPIAQKK